MLGRARRRDQGDTLIEVLFAVTVFSLLAVGALMIMNQGTASAQRSLEITLVRQQIDAQAEALRYLHGSYVAAYRPGLSYDLTDSVTSPAEEWYKLTTSSAQTGVEASPFGGSAVDCPTAPEKSFIINPQTVRYANGPVLKPATTSSKLVYGAGKISLSSAQGIWIEAIRQPAKGTSAGYIDFHIRACWPTLGQSVPMTTGTIVRLYEP